MTTGSYSIGSIYQYGRIATKSWSGADRSGTKVSGWPTSRLLAADGLPLPAHASKEEIAEAKVRAKALAITRGVARTTKKVRFEDHPYSCNWISDLNGRLYYYVGSEVYTFPFESQFGRPGVAYSWSTNDDLLLINKLRDALQLSDFNLGVFLAEAPMALRMITSSAIKLKKSVDYFRRGNYREALRSATGHSRRNFIHDTLASRVLEVQYGWKPLMSDMQAGAQYLAYLLHGSALKTVKVSRKVAGTISNPLVGFDPEASSCFTRGSLIARIQAVDSFELNGLTDVSSIVWEKLPWSFVIDWAIPIGSYLSALSLDRAVRATYVKTIVSRHFVKPLPGSFYWDWNHWYGREESSFSGGSMSRTILSSLDVPLPTLKGVKKILSLQHAINAVALLVSTSKDRSQSL